MHPTDNCGRQSSNEHQAHINFTDSRSALQNRSQHPYGMIGFLFFQQHQSMQRNVRSLHERDDQTTPSSEGMQYKSPNPQNIGLLERWGVKKLMVKKEVIGGVEVELTYHPRTGGRSVVEVTGGPAEIVGFTSTPVKKGSNWSTESRGELEHFINSKVDKPLEMISPEQGRNLAEGKYGDVRIEVPTGGDPQIHFPRDELGTLQDQKRQQQADLNASSKRLGNELREHRHELESAKIQHENAVWDHHELTKDPKKGFPADKADAIPQAKEQIEHFQKREKELEDLIVSEQKKKDDVDRKRKELEESQRPKNTCPAPAAAGPVVPEKPRGYSDVAGKVCQDFKQGAKAEFGRQTELENLLGTLGNATGDGLVRGGIRVVDVLQNGGNREDVIKVVAETAGEVALGTLTNAAAAVAWEGGREVIQQNLPPQVSDYVPSLGTAVKTYQLVNAVYSSNTLEEAAINAATTAADMALQAQCTGLGSKVGAGIALMIPIPFLGTFIGGAIGGAIGTSCYMAVRESMDTLKKTAITPLDPSQAAKNQVKE